MSKKMMKRSLALGALMAFVITGSAMAAELTIKYENGKYTATGDGINSDITTDCGNLYGDLASSNWGNTYIVYVNSNPVDVNVIASQKADNYNKVTVVGGDVDNKIGNNVYGSFADFDAVGNEVIVKDAFMAGGIVGGSAQYNDTKPSSAENNKVYIEKTEVQKSVYGGDIKSDYAVGDGIGGNVSNNEVEIVNSTIHGDVSGGCVHYEDSDAIGNKVTLTDTTINSYISGGHSSFGSAHENELVIKGSTTYVKDNMYGGRAQTNGSANYNKLTIEDGSLFDGNVYGGAANDGVYTGWSTVDVATANGNNVVISGGAFKGIIYGGYADNGLADAKAFANQNTVNITGGTINNRVYGGYGRNEANENIVSITGITHNGDRIYGAYATDGDAVGNTVSIVTSEIKWVNGGFSVTKNANDNIVNIIDSKVIQCVSGGSSDLSANGNMINISGSTVNGDLNNGAINGGWGWLDDANGNRITITDSTVSGYLYGGRTKFGASNGNIVTIESGKFTGNITGGTTWGTEAKDNEVIINDGEFNSVSINGGYGNGDYGNASVADNNTVTIYGGQFNDVDIRTGQVYVEGEAKGTANGNILNLNGGTIAGNVYAAFANGKVVESNDNTMNLSGDADVASAVLYGTNIKTSTGNTLNIAADWSNSNVQSINNFNEINIEEAQWGTAVIEVESLALVDTTVNVDTVRVAGGDDTYAPGKSSAVITSNSEISGEVAGGRVNVFKGVATIYEATVEKSDDNKSIEIQLGGEETATYNAGEMNPQVLVIGESRAAATAFTNQGSELIETGLDALARDNVQENDTKVFAAVYGNASEYATGSEVKVNGWSGIVGVGKTNANGLTVGAFFENGEGNYRTYNDVNGEFMRGDGEACYNGGGFIVRKDNANGVYTEASLRAGNLQNELRNAVRGSEGLTGYDIDTFYYGAHVGIGKVIARGTEGDSMDVYGKFIYTHHDSEDFTIDGDEFHFYSVDSERLRLGFRINEVQNNKLSMYYGAAWEYEFNGDSNNTVVGYDLSTPSLGGSTAIGELGMHYKASEKWSFDLNSRAYTGQRDGFSGSVQANYAF